MKKINCWEYTKCGRQPGGDKVKELGVCIASIEKRTNGIHGGINGGRVCWAIAGTLCRGQIQGSFAQKLADCLKCDFYHLVRKEEGENFVLSKDILPMLQ